MSTKRAWEDRNARRSRMGAILVFLAEMIPCRAVFGQGSYDLIPIFAKIIHHSGACSTTISQSPKRKKAKK